MLTQHDILSYLSEHKYEFKERFDIVKIGLFGSFGRDTANQTSDIDILIELKEGAQDIYLKKRSFQEVLGGYFQRRIDIAREKYLNDRARKAIKDDLHYV